MPKGTEEGEEVQLTGRRFSLRLGQPVRFHLVSSSDDTERNAGELYEIESEHMITLPPLVAVLDAEHNNKNEVEVELVSSLTEVGTLKIECVGLSAAQQRWDVEFQLRKELSAQQQVVTNVTAPPLPARFDEATDKIQVVYGHGKKEFDPKAVKQLRNDLEKLLGKRDSWEVPLLRALFDLLMEVQKKTSPFQYT